MNLADEAAAEVFVESLSLTLRRLKHMASTVEMGRSKEGYQTRDGDAGVLRYAMRGGTEGGWSRAGKRAACDALAGPQTRLSPSWRSQTHLTTLFHRLRALRDISSDVSYPPKQHHE